MALLAFLATAEPASGQLRPITPVTRTVIPEPVIAKIQQGIRDHLRDPPSARFGSIIGGRDGAGTLHFCGWVNSKNSYGGYTGRKPFTGLVLDRINEPLRFVFIALGDTDDSELIAFDVCRKRGLSLQ